MMLITFTSVAEDAKAKLLLYPLFTGLMLAITAWCKPFDDRAGRLLDLVETLCLGTRFFMFSIFAVLLIFQTRDGVTFVFAYGLIISLVLFCIYFLLQIIEQSTSAFPEEE